MWAEPWNIQLSLMSQRREKSECSFCLIKTQSLNKGINATLLMLCAGTVTSSYLWANNNCPHRFTNNSLLLARTGIQTKPSHTTNCPVHTHNAFGKNGINLIMIQEVQHFTLGQLFSIVYILANRVSHLTNPQYDTLSVVDCLSNFILFSQSLFPA